LAFSLAVAEDGPLPGAFDEIQTVVIIFQENRSYVHLLPDFPGATGVAETPKSAMLQRDRDGWVLTHLPISKRFGLDLLPGIRTQFGDLRGAPRVVLPLSRGAKLTMALHHAIVTAHRREFRPPVG
jgi:phospholipase C